MKTKTSKSLLAFTFGAGALVAIVLMRGMLPELYRYIRIRRM
jgi:hypothetical protein